MTRLWEASIAFGAVLALALPAASYASCVPLTAKQQEQRADVIFVGVAVEGPTSTGIQRFRVTRYLKGRGPETASVATGVVAPSDGTGSTTSVSLDVNAGEQWQIYATRRSASVLETSECDGSRTLASTGEGARGSTLNSPDSPAATEDRTSALLLGTLFAALALTSLAFVVRRRIRRRAVASG